jgi:transposase
MKTNNEINIAITAATHGYRAAAIMFNVSRGAVWDTVKKQRDAYTNAGGRTRRTWGKRRKTEPK